VRKHVIENFTIVPAVPEQKSCLLLILDEIHLFVQSSQQLKKVINYTTTGSLVND
jgi:hypothetical protein